MDPITLLIIIGAVTYVAAAPDRTTLRTTRGSAAAVRSAWTAGTPGRAKWARSRNPVLRSAWRTERPAVRGARWWRSAWSAAKRARSDYRAGADRAELARAHARALREDRFRGDPDRLPGPTPVHEPDHPGPDPETTAPERAGEPTEGAPVPDITTIPTTDLETAAELRSEVWHGVKAAEALMEAAQAYSTWRASLAERYEAVPWGTGPIDTAMAGLEEVPAVVTVSLEQEVDALLGVSKAIDAADRLTEATTEQAARGDVRAFQEA